VPSAKLPRPFQRRQSKLPSPISEHDIRLDQKLFAVDKAAKSIHFQPLRPEIAARNSTFLHLAGGGAVAENTPLPGAAGQQRLFTAWPEGDPKIAKLASREWVRVKTGK
jgi:hypothetical protein